MTEEATNKWCPMVRGEGGCTHAFARGMDNIPNTCIGSRCMMWRVLASINGSEGYCGLAGAP